MSRKVTKKKLRELRAQVDDNMADAEVGPLLDEIGRLQEDLGDWHQKFIDVNRSRKYLEEDARWLREPVRWFAEMMETKLRENDHKGGWEDCGLAYLLKRLHEEIRELEEAESLYQRSTACSPDCDKKRLMMQREAADVANIVMMIADQARV